MINSPRNDRIRRYRRLRKKNFRYKEGKFLAEGLQIVRESLDSQKKPECLLCDQRGIGMMQAYADVVSEHSIPCYSVDDEVMYYLSSTVTPQGIIAVSPMIHVSLKRLLRDSPSTILVANRVRDPGNLGNMVRTAEAAGAEGMVICRESADLYNPKTVRSTAGSIFNLPLTIGAEMGDTLNELKQDGYNILAADAHRGTDMWDMEWPERLALVMGNEAWGMPDEETAMADDMVRVPVFGRAESLNVSTAAAVLLYEVERRRSRGG